jgi:hypothetical protein
LARSGTASEDKDASHRSGGSATVGHAFKTDLPHKSSLFDPHRGGTFSAAPIAIVRPQFRERRWTDGWDVASGSLAGSSRRTPSVSARRSTTHRAAGPLFLGRCWKALGSPISTGDSRSGPSLRRLPGDCSRPSGGYNYPPLFSRTSSHGTTTASRTTWCSASPLRCGPRSGSPELAFPLHPVGVPSRHGVPNPRPDRGPG